MKALRFHRFGTPASVLATEELQMPVTAGHELVVRVKAAAINPSDVKNVQGVFKQTILPRTPGRDFSGIVVSPNEHAGEAVWGTGPGLGLSRDGSHAEYISVPPEFVSLKPHKLTFEQAAAIGVPFTTAWAAVMEAGQLSAGQTILIIGAAGAVGNAAVQIANWKQARVLAVDKDPRRITGAQAYINTTEEDLSRWVMEVTGQRGADVVFDAVGGPMFEPGLRSLRHGGRQVAIASTGTSRVTFDLVEFYHNGAHLIGVDSNHFEPTGLKRMMAELNRGFESAALKIDNLEPVAFDRAIGAYQAVAGHEATAKQILIP